jgi:hypothetical protein
VKCGDDAAIGSAVGARLDELGARAALADAWTWARLFGGARSSSAPTTARTRRCR